MMYLGVKSMNFCNRFITECFTKRGKYYYFVAQSDAIGGHYCVKFSEGLISPTDDVTVDHVYVVSDNGTFDKIVSEETIENQLDINSNMVSLFDYIGRIIDGNDFKMKKDFMDYLSLDNISYSTDDNKITADISDIVGIKAVLERGYYTGTIILSEIELVNLINGNILNKVENFPTNIEFYFTSDSIELSDTEADYSDKCELTELLKFLSEDMITSLLLKSKIFEFEEYNNIVELAG